METEFIVCVAAVFFPFPGREMEQASERRSTLGVSKKRGEVGRGGGEREGGEGAFARSVVPFACIFGNACYAGYGIH